MNIVYIGRYNEGEILTGPEKVAKRIFDGAASERKCVFIEYFFDGKKYGLAKKLFGREKVCSVNGSDVFRLGLFRILAFLIEQKPDIIHIISFERFALAAYIYRVFFNVRIVYNVHGIAVYENKFLRKESSFRNFKDCFAEDFYIRHSDIIMLLSRKFKLLFDEYYPVSSRKIRYIKNGTDKEFGNVKSKNVDTEILRIVFISDISRPEKGFRFLKEALEEFSRSAELHVVDRKELSGEIKFKNENINLFFYDKMPAESMQGFLYDKDIFISAAKYEPFGMTCTECMSAGLIPVVTDVTGASELITDGLNGFVFEFGNKEQLNRILENLYDDPELRKSVQEEAVKIYRTVSWSEILKNYLKIYEELLRK
ncbi:MAG: glycosyltransferase family 4 protein [Ignavibacteriae bacterium]|nr:glycosyltransferase family 4 protein [Ignavibacteriota bacterium]